MSEEGKLVLRAEKTAGIIENIVTMYGCGLREASDMYYNSETSTLIEEGVADLNCRSEKYLASLIWEEYYGDR